MVEFSPATREARVRFPDVASFAINVILLFLLRFIFFIFRMSANDPAATDTAAIIQGLRDELQNFENIRLQNERQNEENLNSVSIFIPTQP